MRTFLSAMLALATQASLASGFTPGDTGACCIDDPPACFENFSEFSCQALGGAWQGPGSTCADCAPDPSGACCFDGSDCFDATSTYCDAVDGTWLGPDTTCAQHGSQCAKDPTGACCIGTGCVDLVQAVCKGSGGYWLGPDTTCAANGDSCVNQPLHVPGQYDTIGDAVDDAVDGDEIIVAPGVHYGSGSSVFDTQGKSLYIHSSEGALVTFLDGEGERRIVLCDSGEDAGTVIEGFSMINGASGAGGGIWVRNDSSPVFRECIISGCAATNGGGCSIEGSGPLFDRCEFVENASLAFGSAIDALEGSDFELRECVIQFNTTGDTSAATAAVNLRESSIALIGQTVICENTPLQIVGDWIDGGGNTICSDCIGDLTGDGQIDGGDLTVVLGFWGACSSDCVGDLNGDGLVDGGDITIILAYWGSCP